MNYLHHITTGKKNLSACQSLRRTSQRLSIHSTSDKIGLKEVHHISVVRNNLFALVCFVALTLLSGKILAQNNSNNSSGIKSNSRGFYLSVFAGFNDLGPGNDMESNMSSSGLDATSSSWLFGATAHPFTNEYPIFDIEALYYLAKKSGFSLNFGLINNIKVSGYEAIGHGNHIVLKSKIRSVSLNYAFRSKDKRHNIFIGPLCFIHSVKGVSSRIESPDNNNVKLGVYIGYSLQIIQKTHWFIVIKANYRWAPKSKIGPFVTQHKLGPETFTSEFSPTKVNLACLNVGLSIGVKIDKEK